MAYDEELAEHVRGILSREPGLSEKRMFGGRAFLINGNMAVAASSQGGLLLRVDPAASETLLRDPRATRAVMGGREMAGWLRVDVDTMADVELDRWVTTGVAFARTLPAK